MEGKLKPINHKYGYFADPYTLAFVNGTSELMKCSWSRNGREMTILEGMLYVDPDGQEWWAPAGKRINGLSVPWLLWRIQPPFVGKARMASVFHDVHCELKQFPSKEVHRMFWRIMRLEGLWWLPAFTRWLAVRLFGPRFPGRTQ